jgi:hypothetical protein
MSVSVFQRRLHGNRSISERIENVADEADLE